MKVLLTGGTGSFGQYAAMLFLGKSGTEEIRVFSRDEEKQLQMKDDFKDDRLRFIIGNVKDYDAVAEAAENVDLVVHAAALKHIPVCEQQPLESVKTNLIGTCNVKRAAITCDVPKSVFLSTDKAVNPVNVYGACKMLAERIWLKPESSGLFSSVRYGNIVGSRGSVLPFFKKLKDSGQPLTITDQHMTRFFVTLKQALHTVFYAINNMRGGEVFVPKIKACNIMDLAKAMAGEAYPIRMIGVRPGEKLHETLISEDEWRRTEDQASLYVIHPYGGYKRNMGCCGGQTEVTSVNSPRMTTDEIRELIGDWI